MLKWKIKEEDMKKRMLQLQALRKKKRTESKDKTEEVKPSPKDKTEAGGDDENKEVEEEDAERAIFLIQSMLQDAGVDVNTGKVDLGVLQGKPRSEVSKMQLFMDILKSLEGDNKVAVEERAFVQELEKTEKFSEEEARNYIRRMLREASIYESKPGHYNRV